MDILVWFGMILMMFFILLFMYTLISHLISTNSSEQSFNTLISMASSACSSVQSSSSITFSNPSSEVVQIYDSPSCNSTLYSNPSWFNPNHPYNSTMDSLVNNYDLCYAQLTKSGASQSQAFGQTYIQQKTITVSSPSVYPTLPPYFSQVVFSYPTNFGNFADSYFVFSVNGSINVSVTGGEIQFINSSGEVCDSISFTEPNTNSFPVSNAINFSEKCTSAVVNNENGYINLTIDEEPGSGPFKVVSSPNDMTFSQPPYLFDQTQLSYNCISFPSSFNGIQSLGESAFLSKGTLICEPITCNGNNFILTDSNGNVLNSIIYSSFTFFELSPGGVGAIKITNPNSENIIQSIPIS